MTDGFDQTKDVIFASAEALALEHELIACCFVEPSCVAEAVYGGVTDESFAHPKPRAIWQAMTASADLGTAALGDGAIVSAVLVELGRSGKLDLVGGHAGLGAYINSAPSTPHVDLLVARLREAGLRRQTEIACRQALSEIVSGRETNDLISGLHDTLTGISAQSGRSGAQEAPETAQETLAYLDARSDVDGVRTGFLALDDLLDSLAPGTSNVLCARPGVGKSLLALQIAAEQARIGSHVGVWALEMSRRELWVRLISLTSGIPMSQVRRGRLDSGYQRVRAFAQMTAELPVSIDQTSVTSADIAASARALRQAGKLDLIIVDYLQLMRWPGKAKSTYEGVTANSRDMKLLARELEVPLLLVAQLNRQGDETERPSLNELRDSGAIEQDADVVIGIHCVPETSDVEVSVIKNRHGKTGAVRFGTDYPCVRFWDYAGRRYPGAVE